MTDIGKLLRELRGKDSLRTASEKTGLSHGYISIVEKGIDPRTRSTILPSPETLKSYANGYHYPYEELMRVAGYLEEKDRAGEARYNDAETTIRLIEEEARKLGLSTNDPAFKEMLSDAFNLLRIARGKDAEK